MRVLLVQLPVPKNNFGLKTGNIPFGAACLKQAAMGLSGTQVTILDPLVASHGSDALILGQIFDYQPDILGFTLFAWNRDRSLYLAKQAKDGLGCCIMAGGPEVTPGHPDLPGSLIDITVLGQGEALFRAVLDPAQNPLQHQACLDSRLYEPEAARIFSAAPSPYTDQAISALPGDPMLLETQRGCPFGCRFCHYNKSMKKQVFKRPEAVYNAVQWAGQNDIKEIVFLDPTLNARPDLDEILTRIQTLNPGGRISLTSEIRAERITTDLAERLSRAGFTEFEIGLQSIHAPVLKKMGRPTDLQAFLSGLKALKAHGIRPRIDLIAGLPGDTPDGFSASLDFVMANGLEEDIQVFPLLILPGTYFRRHARELGLVYDPHPPYTLIQTPSFSKQDMDAAFARAEERLDLALIPMPHLDIAYKTGNRAEDGRHPLSRCRPVRQIVLKAPRTETELQALAKNLAGPYQIFIPGAHDASHVRAVTVLTLANPFTPLEIIFLDPPEVPDIRTFLEGACIRRPHFLDKDLDMLYPEPGNRAILFTLVSTRADAVFQAGMARQVFQWTREHLPETGDMAALAHLDGILIDAPMGQPPSMTGRTGMPAGPKRCR